MNPFFIFLFICAFIAIVFWFKNATANQGVSALKGVLIGIGVIIIILVATGRLPIFTGIPLLLLATFRKAALSKLLIPFIKFLAGNVSSRPQYFEMDTQQAISTLELTQTPSREEIVQAHRKKTRDLRNGKNPNSNELARLDAAREFLINEIDSTKNNQH